MRGSSAALRARQRETRRAVYAPHRARRHQGPAGGNHRASAATGRNERGGRRACPKLPARRGRVRALRSRATSQVRITLFTFRRRCCRPASRAGPSPLWAQAVHSMLPRGIRGLVALRGRLVLPQSDHGARPWLLPSPRGSKAVRTAFLPFRSRMCWQTLALLRACRRSPSARHRVPTDNNDNNESILDAFFVGRALAEVCWVDRTSARPSDVARRLNLTTPRCCVSQTLNERLGQVAGNVLNQVCDPRGPERCKTTTPTVSDPLPQPRLLRPPLHHALRPFSSLSPQATTANFGPDALLAEVGRTAEKRTPSPPPQQPKKFVLAALPSRGRPSITGSI